MIQPPNDLRQFASLLKIVESLRGPDGCPWDKEQTHRTLAPYAIEESHELAEAIEAGDEKEMVSELGDVLLQVALHAEIGRQEGRFDIHDVIEAISSKMVRRHPHVFSDTEVSSSSDVVANWSKIKAKEKSDKETSETPMRFDVPLNLPALTRSHKIGEKTNRGRFDWSNPLEVLEKVDEEIQELKEVIEEGLKNGSQKDPAFDKAALEHELGDVLFSIAQLARHLKLEPEQSLRTANTRFEKRFFTMKQMIAESGRDYNSLSLEELEAAWQKAKAKLKNTPLKKK